MLEAHLKDRGGGCAFSLSIKDPFLVCGNCQLLVSGVEGSPSGCERKKGVSET
jgi:hypothetical protein